MTKSKTKKFVNFRQLLVFHARLLSEYQNQYSNPGVGISESPQAIYSTNLMFETLVRWKRFREATASSSAVPHREVTQLWATCRRLAGFQVIAACPGKLRCLHRMCGRVPSRTTKGATPSRCHCVIWGTTGRRAFRLRNWCRKSLLSIECFFSWSGASRTKGARSRPYGSDVLSAETSHP